VEVMKLVGSITTFKTYKDMSVVSIAAGSFAKIDTCTLRDFSERNNLVQQ